MGSGDPGLGPGRCRDGAGSSPETGELGSTFDPGRATRGHGPADRNAADDPVGHRRTGPPTRESPGGGVGEVRPGTGDAVVTPGPGAAGTGRSTVGPVGRR